MCKRWVKIESPLTAIVKKILGSCLEKILHPRTGINQHLLLKDSALMGIILILICKRWAKIESSLAAIIKNSIQEV